MSCNLACQTKIILNGANVSGIARANRFVIERMTDAEFNALDGDEAIKLLNRMEDDAVKVQKLLVKAANYTGPTGKMLE